MNEHKFSFGELSAMINNCLAPIILSIDEVIEGSELMQVRQIAFEIKLCSEEIARLVKTENPGNTIELKKTLAAHLPSLLQNLDLLLQKESNSNNLERIAQLIQSTKRLDILN